MNILKKILYYTTTRIISITLLIIIILNIIPFLSLDAKLLNVSGIYTNGNQNKLLFKNFKEYPKYIIYKDLQGGNGNLTLNDFSVGGYYKDGTNYITIDTVYKDEPIFVNHETIHYNVSRLSISSINEMKKNIDDLIPVMRKQCDSTNTVSLKDKKEIYLNKARTKDEQFLIKLCNPVINIEYNYQNIAKYSDLLNYVLKINSVGVEQEYIAYTTEFLLQSDSNGNAYIKNFDLTDKTNILIYNTLLKEVSKVFTDISIK